MKTTLIFFLAFLQCIYSLAQINSFAYNYKLGSPAASTEKHPDLFVLLGNQATALEIKGLCFGVMAEKKFMLNELNRSLFFLSKTKGKNNISFLLHYSGFAASNIIQADFGITKKLTPQTDLGLRLNVIFSHINGYKNIISQGGEISISHQFSDKLHFGLLIVNPHQLFPGKSVELNGMGCLYKWGILYEFSSQCYLFTDMMKAVGNQADVIMGMAYQFNKKIESKYSFSFRDMSCSLSLGFQLQKVNVCVAGTFHSQLGFYPSVMLSSFQNKKS